MRYLFLALIFTLGTLAAMAQSLPDLDQLMTRRVTDCRDITFNCQALLPRYVHQDNTDSLWLVLQYWVDKCGESERTLRMEILLNLKDKTFYEEHYKNDLLDLLMTYRSTMDNKVSVPNDGTTEASFLKNTNDYDAFTADYARTLAKENGPRTLEYLICEFYGNNFDPLLKALRDNKIPGTAIQAKYNETIDKAKNTAEANVALIGEWWIPTQGARILGQHPGLGFQLGMKRKKFLLDLTCIFRFLNAPNTYKVYSQNTVMSTHHFFGGYIGIDVGREMWRKGKSELDLVGGIGYDGFAAIQQDVDNGIDGKSINSLNINLGVGYRYYYKKSSYISLQPRINSVNYANKAGSDLSGNTISIRFIWGVSSSNFRDHQLTQLGAR
jgi:hypothetical protein